MLPYFCLLAVACGYSGLRTSLHQTALDNFKDAYMPAVLAQVMNNGLGSASFSVNLLIANIKVNVTRTTFAELSVDMANTTIELDPVNQTIWLKIRGLQVDLTSEFMYHTYTTGWTYGEFYLYLEGGSLTIPMEIGVDSEGHLNFTITPISQSFLDIEYQFSTDSYLMDILAFIGSIPPFTYVDSLITDLLFAKGISNLATTLHESLKNLPYIVDLGVVGVDYHFLSCNITNSSYIDARINGTFFPVNISAVVPVQPPESEEAWLGNGQFRVLVTDYMLKTLAWAAFESGTLKGNFTAKNVPNSVPFALTTTGLVPVFPQLKQAFGANKPVELHCSASQAPLLQVAAMVNISFYVACDVVVLTPNATVAFTLMMEVDSQANVGLKRTQKGTYVLGTVKPQATMFSQMNYTNSTVGKINLTALQSTLSLLSQIIAEYINANYLSQGVVLPLPHGMILTNTTPLVTPSAIELDSTPSFAQMAEELASSLY